MNFDFFGLFERGDDENKITDKKDGLKYLRQISAGNLLLKTWLYEN